MIGVVMDALADGPKTQQDLLARAKLKASKGMRRWLQFAWSAMRPAILHGLIVYADRAVERRRSCASISGCRSRSRSIRAARSSNWRHGFSRRSLRRPIATSRNGPACRRASPNRCSIGLGQTSRP